MELLLSILKEYQELGLSSVVDYDKFNAYALTHHSTRLEGSTLTNIETQLLLDEGKTPKGKPLQHSLMVKDHFEALQMVLKAAQQPEPTITPAFIQEINAAVLRHTGAVYHTLLGTVDSSKGQFRKSNVRAGDRYFSNYDKVPAQTRQLCDKLNPAMDAAQTTEQQLLLSFDAQFDLVSIHPFYDGNGRTARLLMNFLQARFQLPLGIVFAEDKADYIDALEQSRTQESLQPFRTFMIEQYIKHLQQDMQRYRDSQQPPQGRYSFIF